MTHRWVDDLGRDVARRWAAGENAPALCALLADLGYSCSVKQMRSWLSRNGVGRGSDVPDDWTPPGEVATAEAVQSVCAAHADMIREMGMLGHSTREIAVAVTKAAGCRVSRNSVLGWCYRNKVRLSSATAQRNGAPMMPKEVRRSNAFLRGPMRWGAGALAQNSTPKPPTQKPRKLADVDSGATIITRRRDGCAFLGGGHEPATQDTPCCNAPVVPGTSWCATHHAVVFSARKDVAA
jgi:hypothetical protein